MASSPIVLLAFAALAPFAAAQKALPQKAVAPVEKQLPSSVPPPPAAREAATAADPRAKQRTVVRMLVHVERAHRDRVARLERLREVFQASGAATELATVARLVDLEAARYDAAVRGYARDLGPEVYAQVRAAIDSSAGASSRPPADTSAPPGGAKSGGRQPGGEGTIAPPGPNDVAKPPRGDRRPR